MMPGTPWPEPELYELSSWDLPGNRRRARRTKKKRLPMKKLICLAVFVCTAAFGQATLTQTTLSAAVLAGDSQVCLTSSSAVRLPSTTSAGSMLFMDFEPMWVQGAGRSSNCFRVDRRVSRSAHVVGGVVYVGAPQQFANSDKPAGGACTASAEPVLPVVNVRNGRIYDCTGSIWVWTHEGTNTAAGGSGTGVPYLGANDDVDLGTHGLRATFLDLGSGTTPSAIDVYEGTGCPSLGTAGKTYTLCFESGVMKKVTPIGSKTIVNLPTGTCSSGQHVDAINADLSVHCTADSGGGGSDVLDFTGPWGQTWFVNGAGGGAPGYAIGSCNPSGGVGGAGVSKSSVAPWTFYQTAGDGSICAISEYYGDYGQDAADFFSGSTPADHKIKARWKVNDRNGDFYFGYSGSRGNYDNFIGCRALATDTNWFSVVINGGSVTAVDTGIPVTVSTSDATGDMLMEVGNAGVANSIYCKVNGTAGTPAAATIAPHVYDRIMSSHQQGGTVSTFGITWIGWQYSGVGSVH